MLIDKQDQTHILIHTRTFRFVQLLFNPRQLERASRLVNWITRTQIDIYAMRIHILNFIIILAKVRRLRFDQKRKKIENINIRNFLKISK
jgi:hypothetical protein